MFRPVCIARTFALTLIFMIYGPIAAAGDADLSLNIVTSPKTAVAGKPLTYSLCVANKGEEAAKSLVLSNPLPNNAKLLSAPSDCKLVDADKPQSGKKLVCKLARLGPGNSVGWSFVVEPGVVDELENTAKISFDKTDANPADNRINLLTCQRRYRRMMQPSCLSAPSFPALSQSPPIRRWI